MNNYPYFYIGYDLKISDFSTTNFSTIFKRMTLEELRIEPKNGFVKGGFVLCGSPRVEESTQIQDILNFSNIRLQDFIDADGMLPPGCDLSKPSEVEIYINGISVKQDVYKIDNLQYKIKILWDIIRPKDSFTFKIPVALL